MKRNFGSSMNAITGMKNAPAPHPKKSPLSPEKNSSDLRNRKIPMPANWKKRAALKRNPVHLNVRNGLLILKPIRRSSRPNAAEEASTLKYPKKTSSGFVPALPAGITGNPQKRYTASYIPGRLRRVPGIRFTFPLMPYWWISRLKPAIMRACKTAKNGMPPRRQAGRYRT